MKSDAEKLKQRQTVKKYLVFALMFLVFAACMWFIFAPSESDRAADEQQKGFNTELPDPRNAGIVDDKMTAYEQESMRQKREEKMRTLEELAAPDSAPAPGNAATLDIPSDVVIVDDETDKPVAGGSRNGSFSSSHTAYRQINETLGSFYEQPAVDHEKEAMREELEQLRQYVAQQQTPGISYDEQVALLEKSYELAARYMPDGNGGSAKHGQDENTGDNGKAKAVPVGRVSAPVVSSLAQPVSDSVMIARLTESRNFGFNTSVGCTATQEKNTISVCVHGDQTVISGQSVRLRLLEPMRVGRHELPRNALLTGECRIQGERLNITISQVEYSGNIIPVELTVHDNDGQPGIFIPGSMESNAVREMAANMGQNLGTTISITNQSAGDQLLSELGKGAIQGVSQYISKKMRQEKVHLKSGHTLMLYQKQ
ncbi:MAG: conjugative transposon protein TraM [Parabacteroides sp.]|nr:conjugative transposon protein TraM [Parabacteroides sp.]